MIVRNERDVTDAVIAELGRIDDPRLREVLVSGVRHLHAWIRDVRLTERELQQAAALIARLGQLTTASHNEVVLAAGSLGVSSLVCLLNNGDGGREPTTANLLGPFWRPDAPRMDNGASIVRSPTPGAPTFVQARVVDRSGRPVPGADVDVWQASADGYYENQDPAQAEMNLRGTFTTDDDGRIAFRTVKPAGYPIPVSGPVGDLLRVQGRHNLRPAHIHFLIRKPGWKTQFSQVYSHDDPQLDTDVQFGVTQALIGRYERHERAAPDADVVGPWYSLDHTFVIEPGESTLPRAPITAKASERPASVVLQRKGD